MSEPFLAEIRIFAGPFAPRGWAYCDGQPLPIAQNTALYSIIRTAYGGDGYTTMQLPNLQGRVPMGAGYGPGLTARKLGQKGGATTATLTLETMGTHTHMMTATGFQASNNDPTSDEYLARAADNNAAYAPLTRPPVRMYSKALAEVGGDGPHNNMQPFLAIDFIIALVGLYPARS